MSFLWIAGPCVIESEEQTVALARALSRHAEERGLRFVFKASFDKANRTSLDSYRGPGLDEGLRILGAVKRATGCAVLTDVHLPAQVGPVAAVVDWIQIPAFLCRQTDLLVEAGRSGLPINVKKGQFLAPEAMIHAVDKVRSGGAKEVWVTERGTSFGHGDLVVDFRGVHTLTQAGLPVCFDATHSAQRPPTAGGGSGGRRAVVPTLARAAVAAGVDALFTEVHADPANARSDAATQWPLDRVAELLDPCLAHWRARHAP